MANKRRNKRYIPKPIRNPIEAAIKRVGVLTSNERSRLIDPVNDCMDKLKLGGFDVFALKHLIDSMNVAQALTMPGFGLLPDHVEKFSDAQQALHRIGNRFNETDRWVATGDELRLIETAIEFHGYQLDFASAGDLERATIKVDKTLAGMQRTGNNHLITVIP